jgi:hypothetical protein
MLKIATERSVETLETLKTHFRRGSAETRSHTYTQTLQYLKGHRSSAESVAVCGSEKVAESSVTAG